MRIRTPMLPGICHAAKFKTRQFVPGTDSPNLMLAQVSRYTVYILYVQYVIAKVPLEKYFSYYVVCCVNQLLLILKAHLWLSND